MERSQLLRHLLVVREGLKPWSEGCLRGSHGCMAWFCMVLLLFEVCLAPPGCCMQAFKQPKLTSKSLATCWQLLLACQLFIPAPTGSLVAAVGALEGQQPFESALGTLKTTEPLYVR